MSFSPSWNISLSLLEANLNLRITQTAQSRQSHGGGGVLWYPCDYKSLLRQAFARGLQVEPWQFFFHEKLT